MMQKQRALKIDWKMQQMTINACTSCLMRHLFVRLMLVPCRYLDECPRDLGVYVGIIRLLDNHEASFSNPSHLVEL